MLSFEFLMKRPNFTMLILVVIKAVKGRAIVEVKLSLPSCKTLSVSCYMHGSSCEILKLTQT